MKKRKRNEKCSRYTQIKNKIKHIDLFIIVLVYQIAPVIELNEIEYMAPMVQKVETQHRFYGGRQENDLPQVIDEIILKKNHFFNEMLLMKELEKAPRLAKTTYIGKYEPVKWSCRAPLKNGKLCPRMDRFKCPLHGKIVARDERGEFANAADRDEYEKRMKASGKEAVPAWQDRELIADINAATGLNLQVVESRADKKKNKRKSGDTAAAIRENTTTRSKLEKRLLNPKNLAKIGSILDSIERRQYHERFHHNFNYALDS